MPAVSRPVVLFREKEEATMIKVSVFYPNKEGSKFDMAYYLNSHIPMVQKKCGASLRGGSVDRGLSAPEARARYSLTSRGARNFMKVDSLRSDTFTTRVLINGELASEQDHGDIFLVTGEFNMSASTTASGWFRTYPTEPELCAFAGNNPGRNKVGFTPWTQK